MIRFEKLKEVIMERNTNIKRVFYNDYNEIVVEFKDTNKYYFYKNNNYRDLLNKLGIPTLYSRDVECYKHQLNYYIENNHKSVLNFKCEPIKTSNYDVEIQKLESILKDVEDGKYYIIKL